jgi:hypothetical protein
MRCSVRLRTAATGWWRSDRGGTWFELEELVDIDSAEDLELVLADPRTPEALRQRLRDAIR